jgi:hypothetical protein
MLSDQRSTVVCLERMKLWSIRIYNYRRKQPAMKFELLGWTNPFERAAACQQARIYIRYNKQKSLKWELETAMLPNHSLMS